MEQESRPPIDKLLDPKFFLESFTKIKGKEPGLIPFRLKPAQVDMFNTLNSNSRVMVLKARQLGMCLHPETLVLTSGLRWIKLEDVRVGDVLIGVDEYPKSGRGLHRYMRHTLVQAKWDVHEVAYKLTMSNGEIITATGQHRFLYRHNDKHFKNKLSSDWLEVENMSVGGSLRIVTEPTSFIDDYENGWFSGILDGEGSLSFGSKYDGTKAPKGAKLCIAQRAGAVLDRVKKYADSKGYLYQLHEVKDARSSGAPCYTLTFNRSTDIFKILTECRPSRFMDYLWWEGRSMPRSHNSGSPWVRIVKIEKLESQRMIDLQTSTKTFIANGFLSHNSTAVAGYLFHRTVTTPGVNTALIGYNSDLTAELLDKVKTFYKSMPDSVKPKVQYNSKYEVSFPALDSKILVLPSSENVGRGYTLHNVLCVDGETVVYKNNGKQVHVQDLQSNDRIITGNGSPGTVKYIVKKPNTEELYRIKVAGAFKPLRVTGDHKVLVSLDGNGEFGWMPAVGISKGMYMAYPRKTITESLVKISLESAPEDTPVYLTKLPSSLPLGMLAGYYLNYGSARLENNSLIFKCSNYADYCGIVELVKQTLKPWMHSKIHLSHEGKPAREKDLKEYSLMSRDKSAIFDIEVLFSSPMIPLFFLKNFGTNSGTDSTFISSEVFSYGKHFCDGLLTGVIEFQNRKWTHSRAHIFTTTNSALIIQMQRLAAGLGLGFMTVNSSPISNGMHRWTLDLLDPDDYKICEKYYAVKVLSSKKDAVDEFVYDVVLEDEPHNFLTQGGIVHNCTELAFWDKAEDKMLAIENAVPASGKIIVESTPNSVSNLFYRMWKADNGYVKKKYGWWWEYSQSQIDEIKKRINDPQRFAQEYGLEFLSTGRPVFPVEIMKQCRSQVFHLGQEVTLDDGTKHKVYKDQSGLVVFAPPRFDRNYVMGVDVAEGISGGDYSVIKIFDRTTGEEVASWRGHMTADRLGVEANKWGRMYHNALIVVESNNHGLTTITKLRDLLYPNMYFRPTKFDALGSSFSDRMGWKTTSVTKGLMIDDLREALIDNVIKIRSEEFVDEMLTFVFDDLSSKMGAKRGYHDDEIMATALAFQGFKVLYSGTLDQLDYEKYLPKSTSY